MSRMLPWHILAVRGSASISWAKCRNKMTSRVNNLNSLALLFHSQPFGIVKAFQAWQIPKAEAELSSFFATPKLQTSPSIAVICFGSIWAPMQSFKAGSHSKFRTLFGKASIYLPGYLPTYRLYTYVYLQFFISISISVYFYLYDLSLIYLCLWTSIYIIVSVSLSLSVCM